MNDISNIVVYNNGELELKVSVIEDTIWLTQSQMSELFGTSTDNIGLHLKNIYREIELNENSTTENFSVVRQEGKRKVTRLIKNSHDRFLIIDKKEVYHLGASIKDLGQKWFAFSKIDIRANDLLSKLI